MGGIVSRLYVATYGSTMVDAVLTMSTPHLLPPVTFDPEMEKVYASINNPATPSPPLLVSICGGLADSQIASDACALSRDIMGESVGFATFTTGMAGVWTGVDHQAMVWCDQVRWRVAKALLEMTRDARVSWKLETAKLWLMSPDIADSPGEAPHESSQMSMIVLQDTQDLEILPSNMSVSQCDHANRCKDIDFQSEPIPWAIDRTGPFPVPGEGIRPSQVGHVLTLRDLESGDTIRLRPQPAVTIPGIHRGCQVKGLSWGMSTMSGGPDLISRTGFCQGHEMDIEVPRSFRFLPRRVSAALQFGILQWQVVELGIH